MSPISAEHLNLSHFYVLGWRAPGGRNHLTSFSGERPITAVLTGPWRHHGPPLWEAEHTMYPPLGHHFSEFRVHLIPSDHDQDPEAIDEYARDLGGCVIMAWYFSTPIVRRNKGR